MFSRCMKFAEFEVGNRRLVEDLCKSFLVYESTPSVHDCSATHVSSDVAYFLRQTFRREVACRCNAQVARGVPCGTLRYKLRRHTLWVVGRWLDNILKGCANEPPQCPHRYSEMLYFVGRHSQCSLVATIFGNVLQCWMGVNALQRTTAMRFSLLFMRVSNPDGLF